MPRKTVWEPGELATWNSRFWKRVIFTDTCWEYDGGHTRGYAAFSLIHPRTGKWHQVGGHRIAYETLVGPIPTGFFLDHLCRNPGCLNPKHLEVVAHRENTVRGVGFIAKNVLATHCPRGHEYTAENTRVYKGQRNCRACSRRTSLAYYHKAGKEKRKQSAHR